VDGLMVAPSSRPTRGEELQEWSVDILGFAAREADAEARRAYAEWKRLRTEESEVVYRAAMERADAARAAARKWRRGLTTDAGAYPWVCRAVGV